MRTNFQYSVHDIDTKQMIHRYMQPIDVDVPLSVCYLISYLSKK